jgi:hypothetical protein
MRTCLQDDVRGRTDCGSCCQDVVYDDDRPAAQLACCIRREFEHSINILQAFRIRQLCLKRRATGLEKKAAAGVALEIRREHSACDVGKVTNVSLIPGAEPRNGNKNRPVSQWKSFCEARQHAGKLTGQLILTAYLHLQDGLSQGPFIPVGGEARRRTGGEVAVAPSRVTRPKRGGTALTDRKGRFLATEKTCLVSEDLAKN